MEVVWMEERSTGLRQAAVASRCRGDHDAKEEEAARVSEEAEQLELLLV
jgi:hypothetical protein